MLKTKKNKNDKEVPEFVKHHINKMRASYPKLLYIYIKDLVRLLDTIR